MVILPQRRQEVVDVKVLFIYGYGTLCHLRTVFIAHELVEGVETGDYVAVRPHLVKEHRQRGSKLTALGLAHMVILRLPQRQQQGLDAVLFLHVENSVFGVERVE